MEFNYQMSPRIAEALFLATKSHAGQTRKYNGEPFINHPLRVANEVSHFSDSDNEDVIIAALLHDTVEDSELNIGDIFNTFDGAVAQMVAELTNVNDGSNRATRKRQEVKSVRHYSDGAKLIRLADIIDNAPSTLSNSNEKFSRLYISEKRAVVEAMSDPHPELFNRVMLIINWYNNRLSY